MGCGCRGGGRAGTRATSGATVAGFDFIPPGGGEPTRFLTAVEARKAQRRAGGGTIIQVVE
jgi:hypothetical protein